MPDADRSECHEAPFARIDTTVVMKEPKAADLMHAVPDTGCPRPLAGSARSDQIVDTFAAFTSSLPVGDAPDPATSGAACRHGPWRDG